MTCPFMHTLLILAAREGSGLAPSPTLPHHAHIFSVDRTDPLTRSYYERTHAVIFVYDVTNPETLWNSQVYNTVEPVYNKQDFVQWNLQ